MDNHRRSSSDAEWLIVSMDGIVGVSAKRGDELGGGEMTGEPLDVVMPRRLDAIVDEDVADKAGLAFGDGGTATKKSVCSPLEGARIGMGGRGLSGPGSVPYTGAAGEPVFGDDGVGSEAVGSR
jgi:hypothetical protein